MAAKNGALSMRILGDPSSLLRAVAKSQTALGGFASAAAGSSSKARGSLGMVGAALGATGLAGELGQVSGILERLGGSFETMGGKGKASVGKIMGGVGIGAAGIGAIALGAAHPLEQANATLKQVVEDAGGSMGEIKGQVDSLDKRMQGLGHTYADTNEALGTLVVATKDPNKAIADMGVVSLLAAKGHKSLAEAASDEARIIGGNTRILKSYGINVADITSKGKDAAKEQKAAAAAAGELAKKQQALNDVKARLGMSTGKGGAADAAAVATAQREQAIATEGVQKANDRLAAAGQHLQAVQAAIASGHSKGAAAAAELQRAQAAVGAAEQGVTDAQTKAAAAGNKVAAAQDKASGAGNLNAAQQIELRKATDEYNAAQAKATQTAGAAKASQDDLGKSTLTSDQINQMLIDRLHGVDKAQADTWGGKMRAAKATVEDFAATVGDKYGKQLLAAGPLMAGFGGILESHVIGKTAKGIVSAGKFGVSVVQMGAKTVAWAATTGASAIAGAASWVASMATMAASSIAAGAAMIVPFLPIIAVVAAVGVAGYLLYRNWDTVKGALIGAWNAISGAATSAFGSVEGAVKAAIGWVEGLPGRLGTLATDSLRWLEDIGKNLITGMWNGITSMGDWLLKQLEGFAKKALGPFAKVFGIKSPSTVMAGYGLNLVQGLADGISRHAPVAQRAMQGMVAPPKLNVASLIGPTAPYPATGTGVGGGVAGATPGVSHLHQHETFHIEHMDVHAADLTGLVTDSRRQAQLSAMRGEEPTGGLW